MSRIIWGICREPRAPAGELCSLSCGLADEEIFLMPAAWWGCSARDGKTRKVLSSCPVTAEHPSPTSGVRGDAWHRGGFCRNIEGAAKAERGEHRGVRGVAPWALEQKGGLCQDLSETEGKEIWLGQDLYLQWLGSARASKRC